MIYKELEGLSITTIYKGIEASNTEYNFPVIRKGSLEEQEKSEKRNNEKSLNTITRKEDERSQTSGKKTG